MIKDRKLKKSTTDDYECFTDESMRIYLLVIFSFFIQVQPFQIILCHFFFIYNERGRVTVMLSPKKKYPLFNIIDFEVSLIFSRFVRSIVSEEK